MITPFKIPSVNGMSVGNLSDKIMSVNDVSDKNLSVKNKTNQQLIGFQLKHFDEICLWIRTKQFIMAAGKYNGEPVIAHFYDTDQSNHLRSEWIAREVVVSS
jgi:hypothetical protein